MNILWSITNLLWNKSCHFHSLKLFIHFIKIYLMMITHMSIHLFIMQCSLYITLLMMNQNKKSSQLWSRKHSLLMTVHPWCIMLSIFANLNFWNMLNHNLALITLFSMITFLFQNWMWVLTYHFFISCNHTFLIWMHSS